MRRDLIQKGSLECDEKAKKHTENQDCTQTHIQQQKWKGKKNKTKKTAEQTRVKLKSFCTIPLLELVDSVTFCMRSMGKVANGNWPDHLWLC